MPPNKNGFGREKKILEKIEYAVDKILDKKFFTVEELWSTTKIEFKPLHQETFMKKKHISNRN